ncbi:Calx-beta domain-containing protein [Thalassoroseus pseudoceratinae]|uniref:Calx-beta domain-containing protein n=1 Tax=Thalassoroseus pseudoceratinae TaxID=2713176 RepID=UPI001420BBB0|nr:Calx-beta domain-containing protein [Thalassoroseus pseudoceratinae]
MLLSNWLNFLRGSFTRKRKTGGRRRVRLQPMTSNVEQLETRELLTGDPLIITVDVADDSSNSNTDPGDISIREAIQMANDNPGEDQIIFSESLAGSTIVIDGGELTITDDLTIVGLGAEDLTISGADSNRVFFIDNADVHFAHFTVADGFARGGDGEDSEFGGGGGGGTGMGGGIFVDTGSNVVVQDMIFLDNQAVGGDGGDAGVPGAGNTGGAGGDSSIGGAGANTQSDATEFGTGGGGGNGSADGSTSLNGRSGLNGGGGGGGGGAIGIGGYRGAIGLSFDHNSGYYHTGLGRGGDAFDGVLHDDYHGEEEDIPLATAPAANAGGGGGGAGMGGAIFVRDHATLSVVDTHFARNRAIGGEAGRHSTGVGAGVGGAIFAMDDVVVNAVGITFGNGSDQANIQSSYSTFPSSPASDRFEYGTTEAISNSAVYGEFANQLPGVTLVDTVSAPEYLGVSFLNYSTYGQNFNQSGENGQSLTSVETILDRLGSKGIREEVGTLDGIAITSVDDSNGLWFAVYDGVEEEYTREVISTYNTLNLEELIGVPAVIKSRIDGLQFRILDLDELDPQMQLQVPATLEDGVLTMYVDFDANDGQGPTAFDLLAQSFYLQFAFADIEVDIIPSGYSFFEAEHYEYGEQYGGDLTEIRITSELELTDFTPGISESSALVLTGTEEITFLADEFPYTGYYGGSEYYSGYNDGPFETLTHAQPTITFRAWDETGAVAGDRIDTDENSTVSTANGIAVVDVVDPAFYGSNAEKDSESETSEHLSEGISIILTPDTNLPFTIPVDLVPVSGNRQHPFTITGVGGVWASGPVVTSNHATMTSSSPVDFGNFFSLSGVLQLSSLDSSSYFDQGSQAIQNANIRFGYYTTEGNDLREPISVIRSAASTDAGITHFKIDGLENGTLYKDAEFTQELGANEFVSYGNGNAYLYFRPDDGFKGVAEFRIIESTSDSASGVNFPTSYTEIDNDAPIFLTRSLDGYFADADQFQITNITNGTLYYLDGESEVTINENDYLDWEIFGVSGSFELYFRPDSGFTGTGSFDVQSAVSGEGDPELVGTASTKTIDVLRINKVFVLDKPVLSAESSSAFEGDDGETYVSFTVTRSGELGLIGETTVDYAVTIDEDDTASANDFVGDLPSGTLTFREGETTRVIKVRVNGDELVEGNETFSLKLSNISSNTQLTKLDVSESHHTGVIYSDDLPEFTIEAADITEGDEGTKQLTFTVTLLDDVDGGIEVNYSTQIGSNSGPSNKLYFEGTANEIETLSFIINGNTDYGKDAAYSVSLDSASVDGHTLPFSNFVSSISTSATVINDDAAIVSVEDIEHNEETEGKAKFTVTLSAALDVDVTFDYNTVDGTATTEDSDYTGSTGTATIKAGDTSVEIEVDVPNDSVVELSQTFQLQLSNLDSNGEFVVLKDSDLIWVADTTLANTESEPIQTLVQDGFYYLLNDDGIHIFSIGGDQSLEKTLTIPTTTAGEFASFDVTHGAGESAAIVVALTGGHGFQSIIVDADRQEQLGVTTESMTPNDADLDEYQLVRYDNNDVRLLAISATKLDVHLPGESTDPDTYRSFALADLGLSTVADAQFIGDDEVLVLDTTGKVVILDLSEIDDEEVTTLDTYSATMPPASVHVSGRYAHVVGASDKPLIILDISNPENIVEAGTNTGLAIVDYAVDGKFAYIATETDGLEVYDVSEPTSLKLVDSVASLTGLQSVAVNDGTIWVGAPIDESTNFSVSQFTFQSAATGTITDSDTAVITVDDIQKLEGDSETTDFTFTIAMDRKVEHDVTVDYKLVAGTATAGLDYTDKSGTVTISAGNTSATVTISVIGEVLVEDDETFSIELSNIDAGEYSVEFPDDAESESATATIENEDIVKVSINDITITEGDINTSSKTFVVTLSSPINEDVTIDFASQAVTATEGVDYAKKAGQLVITAGQTSGTITVEVAGDSDAEADETLNMVLSNPDAGSYDIEIVDGTGVATIDNDDVSKISVGQATIADDVDGSVVLSVTLDRPVAHQVTVDYSVTDGTTNSHDYTNGTGTVTFAPNQTSAVIVINPADDMVVELNETFTVNLSNVQSGGFDVQIEDGTGEVTLTNQLKSQLVFYPSGVGGESETGEPTTGFEFHLTLPVDHDVTVDYTTSDGTATAGSDYTAKSGSITIPAGQRYASLRIPILDDSLSELTESIQLSVSNLQAGGRNVELPSTTSSTFINDNDLLTLSVGDSSFAEFDAGVTLGAGVTVSLNRSVDHDLTVNFTATDGTATSGSNDYGVRAGTLTIPAGKTTGVIPYDVFGDNVVEADEVFYIDLSDPSAGDHFVQVTDSRGTVTIQNNDSALVSLDELTSVDEANGKASFTVSLSKAVDETVTIGYATSNGTATGGSDFTAATGTIEIPAGQTQGVIEIDITDDQLVELDENFTLTLTSINANTRNVAFADAKSRTVTISDNDTETISVGDVQVTEGETDVVNFTVSLTSPVSQDVTVSYETVAESAKAGSDFTAKTGTITIPAGQSSANVSVELLDDNATEISETFALNIFNLQANGLDVDILDSTGRATVLNDDQSNFSINDISLTEGNDGVTTRTLTVTLSNPSDADVSFDYVMANGTAFAGSDFKAEPGSLTIPAGETSGTITVEVLGDRVTEADEYFTVQLSDFEFNGRDHAVVESVGRVSILNDDSTEIGINDVSATETDTEGQVKTFTIALDHPVDRNVTVSYATADGSAKAGVDYIAKSGTLTIPAGQTSGTVSVTLIGDTVVEADEAFVVEISNVQAFERNVSIEDGQGQLTLADNDFATVSVNDLAIAEADAGTIATAGFAVVLSQPVDRDVTVEYATANGTANGGSDFIATTGTLTIPAGQTRGIVNVGVTGDNLVELSENFALNIANVSAEGRDVTIADSQGLATITNDDSAAVSIGDVRVRSGNSESLEVVFNVSLSQPSDADVQIDFATVDGTAIAGEDYTATTGTLTIPAGQTSAQITVDASGSRFSSEQLNFTVDLANLNASGRDVTVADSQAEAVIRPLLQTVVSSAVDPEMISIQYPSSASGNFDGDESGLKDDLLFWNPATGENLLLLEDGTSQENPIGPTVINDGMFRQLIVGNFDEGDSDSLFFWDPASGTNRLLHLSYDTETNQVSANLQQNAIVKPAINSNDFDQVVVGNFDGGGAEDLFFYNAVTGKNRLIHLAGDVPGETTVAVGIRTNLVSPTAINGNDFESVHVGHFIEGGPDELLFINLETGKNRVVDFATDVAGVSTTFASVRTNVIERSAFNGNMFPKMAIGDFNSDGLDEVFFWDPSSGKNRLAVVDGAFEDLDFTIIDNPISNTAINGNQFTDVVERVSGNGGDELFFWNPLTGDNRVVNSDLPTL